MGELTPVNEIDGRMIQNKSNSVIREQLYKAYKQLTETEGELIIWSKPFVLNEIFFSQNI